jgi:hypothetical protein
LTWGLKEVTKEAPWFLRGSLKIWQIVKALTLADTWQENYHKTKRDIATNASLCLCGYEKLFIFSF